MGRLFLSSRWYAVGGTIDKAGTALTVSGFYQSTYRGGVMDSIILPKVKPCRSCGGINRGPGGKCRDCERLREEVKRRLSGIKKVVKYIGPCKKCGSSDTRSDGTCRPCSNAYSKEYYKANKEKLLSASKAWAEMNRDRSREIKKKWADANKVKQRECIYKWKNANSERFKEKRKEWEKNNKNVLRIYCLNRRRKIANGKLSKTIVDDLMLKQNGRCPACRELLNEDYHLDHIMPIALGGKNEDSNIQLLHSRCNMKKNAKHPVDFMQSNGYLI